MSNVIQGQFPPAPIDPQQEIVNTIVAARASGKEFDLFGTARQLGLTHAMTKVRDQLIDMNICTRNDWNAAIKAAAVHERLGCNPKTAVELVDAWIKNEKVTVNFQKDMRRTTLPVYLGHPISSEDRADCGPIDGIAGILENTTINTETMNRDLRMLSDELKMGFTPLGIADGVSAWFDGAVKARVLDVYTDIAYNGGEKQQVFRDAWAAVCSQFDPTDSDPEMVEAVLSKFIWQVKRKMIGKDITNHLMPVLLGPQGVGKSTFVTDTLLKPIEELVGSTDFANIEDERNFEQWRNFVLFLDEMGYAAKADIDNVKNKITARTVTGRPMRTNDNVQYRQNATFIGCSNKELNQLIRDETGNRRFAALRFANEPDWTKTEGLNARLLWKSVNEHGPDPIMPVKARLAARQELNREKSQVEEWLDQHQVPLSFVGKKQPAQDLFRDYQNWALTYAGGRVMDFSSWGKEFTRLINSAQVKAWEKKMPGNKAHYQFNGQC